MNVAALKPKFFVNLPFPFPRILKWVSTLTPKSCPQLPKFPLNHLTKPSDYELSLVSALKSCSSLFAISQGQQLHSFVLKSGLQSNIFIQNSLINLYSKCGLVFDARKLFESCSYIDFVSCNIMLFGYVKSGQLDDARQLFDKMPERGCVAYTTMVMGLAQSDCWVEAIRVFKDMRFAGVTLNQITLSSVISAYAHLGGIREGRMLHAVAIQFGIESLNLVSTNLVHVYCVCSSLGDARVIFNEMDNRNIVSWNVMLNGYSKAGLVDLGRELFEEIPVKDVVSWGTMIDGYVQVERLGDALMLFRLMLHTGVGANRVMLVDLLSACGRSMAVRQGQQFHSTIVKLGFDSYDFMQATIIHFYAACHMIGDSCSQFEMCSKDHISSWNALVAGLVRNGMINSARQIFDEIPKKDVMSWSSMISGYAQSGQPNFALELFHEMVDCGIKPNEITMVSVLSAIASLGTLEEGRLAHEFIHNNSIALNENLSAALIDMYAKCGSINSALETFNKIRYITSSVSPWNAIICGLAMHGYAGLSLKLFSDLKRLPVKLNTITFIGVLSACCHGGLVDEGREYFRNMKSLYGVEPNIKHYGCMVDLLGRAGQLEEADELVRNMPMKADVVIWGTLLAACRTHGNVEIGERAAQSLAKLEPAHGAGRVLLSNIYADVGRWDDVVLVRRAMQSQRMEKSPGCSGVV